jgi:hypothetical protein
MSPPDLKNDDLREKRMGVLLLIKKSISEMWLSVNLRALSTYCMSFLSPRCVDNLPIFGSEDHLTGVIISITLYITNSCYL